MGKLKTTEQFIEDARAVHGNLYDYSEVVYVNSKKPIIIKCQKHGTFNVIPNNHLSGKKCSKCSERYNMTTSEFISECKNVHGNTYDYSHVVYKNNKQKISIRCKEHNHSFILNARSHLDGIGCSKCKIQKYIPLFRKIHGDFYSYEKSEYNGFDNPITITCKIHGDFQQNPFYHMDGCGCPQCGYKSSIGESRISNYLIENGYSFKREHRFSDCKYKNTLPFDFYIESINTCIEFDGIQHFQSVDYFGGDESFKKQIEKDEIKNDFCLRNGIKLIRISNNNMNNIVEVLNEGLQ